MSLHFNIITQDVRDIPDGTRTAWIASGNPKANIWLPLFYGPQPAYEPATHRIIESLPVITAGVSAVIGYTTTPHSQAVLDAMADEAERIAVKDLITTLAADKLEADADLAEAQLYIDLAAPTNAERNTEVLNATKRDKRHYQREKRVIRAVSRLLKSL